MMLTKGYLITDKSGEMKKSLLTSNKRGLDLRGLEKTVAISKDLDGLNSNTFEVWRKPLPFQRTSTV
jgi:hypothetical protein